MLQRSYKTDIKGKGGDGMKIRFENMEHDVLIRIYLAHMVLIAMRQVQCPFLFYFLQETRRHFWHELAIDHCSVLHQLSTRPLGGTHPSTKQNKVNNRMLFNKIYLNQKFVIASLQFPF